MNSQTTEAEINSLVQIIEAMPSHLQLSWVAAVKKWNDTQLFREDIYAIPRKGGESYAEVKSLRDHFNHEMKGPKAEAPVAKKEENDDIELIIHYDNLEKEGKLYTKEHLGKEFNKYMKMAKIYPGGNHATVRMPNINTDASMSVNDMQDVIKNFLKGTHHTPAEHDVFHTKAIGKADKKSNSIMIERLQTATYGDTAKKGAFLKAGFTEQDWKTLLSKAKKISEKKYELKLPDVVGQATEQDILNI
jgi:hypothetical protein